MATGIEFAFHLEQWECEPEHRIYAGVECAAPNAEIGFMNDRHGPRGSASFSGFEGWALR
jgi:hypothetical protein